MSNFELVPLGDDYSGLDFSVATALFQILFNGCTSMLLNRAEGHLEAT
jgi:hypothetical protein